MLSDDRLERKRRVQDRLRKYLASFKQKVAEEKAGGKTLEVLRDPPPEEEEADEPIIVRIAE